jgi:hypothetical protein
MPNKEYPYQNLSLKTLKGEAWGDVPGYDGEYEVSNSGRIKSLRRWRASGRNTGYYTKDRIRKPISSVRLNEHIGEKNYLISIALKQNGVSHTTAIARYMYYVFVEPFDINNPDIIVSYKDCNGRNLTPKNLFLTSRRELIKRSYQLKRCFPYWQNNKLPVLQLDMKNKVVAKFSSITEASTHTGFSLSAIAECMKGHIYQHKGYRWTGINGLNLNDKKKAKEEFFNSYLWEKIGRPKTSKNNPIPVLNLSLKSCSGEQWKSVNGLNGSYQISNLGRIKSLARFKSNNVWAKENIQRLIADIKPGRSGSSLLTPLTREGKKTQQSVARLVYFHFVKKFDMSDKMIIVSYKDGCFYNLSYKNLYLRRRFQIAS